MKCGCINTKVKFKPGHMFSLKRMPRGSLALVIFGTLFQARLNFIWLLISRRICLQPHNLPLFVTLQLSVTTKTFYTVLCTVLKNLKVDV